MPTAQQMLDELRQRRRNGEKPPENRELLKRILNAKTNEDALAAFEAYAAERGETLRESPSEADAEQAASKQEEEEGPSPEVINAFGMFWQRENVLWRQRPALFGAAHVDACRVDFCDQYGIYLLYEGREVIYVGRAINRSLGTRLFEHTQDRLSARWDRFSWFGLRPVRDDGSLAPPDEHTHHPEQLIPAFEAVLIEAVEPRQNRKRGDDIALAEYIQLRDPEIQA